jgi:hypothetical protein
MYLNEKLTTLIKRDSFINDFLKEGLNQANVIISFGSVSATGPPSRSSQSEEW